MPAGLEAGSSLDDLWRSSVAVGSAPGDTRRRVAEGARRRAAAADAAVAQELAAEQLSEAMAEADAAGFAGATGSTGDGQAFMEALSTSTPMVTPKEEGGAAARSARTEAEAIRANREARMQAQGLTGGTAGAAADGGWRAEDRSDGAGSGATARRRPGEAELTDLLQSEAEAGATDNDATLSAEQFTLCAVCRPLPAAVPMAAAAVDAAVLKALHERAAPQWFHQRFVIQITPAQV